MSERLADVGRHIATVGQLGAVVDAMRGIAASRAQQGRALLPAIRVYADVAARALGQALRLADAAPPVPSVSHIGEAGLILFGAEQGFAGAFGDRVLDEAAPVFAESHVFLIGSRTGAHARERGLAVGTTLPGPLRAAAIPAVATQLMDMIYDYLRKTGATRIDTMYPVWTAGPGLTVTRKSLLPLDLSQFAVRSAGGTPLIQLPVADLMERLSEEYMFASLCEAATESLVAENEARITTMAAAGYNIDAKRNNLQALERLTRQEDVTAEVVELATGARSRLAREHRW